MTHAQLHIDGMHCGGCVSRVTSALKNLPGVTVESVDIGSAKVALADNASPPAALVQALEKMGFDARLVPATSS